MKPEQLKVLAALLLLGAILFAFDALSLRRIVSMIVVGGYFFAKCGRGKPSRTTGVNLPKKDAT